MERIGVLGLGIMGLAMARNAARGGYAVLVWNRSAARREAARAAGLSIGASPREVAGACDATIVDVTDAAATRAVFEGQDGLLAADLRGRTVVQAGTIDEATTLHLARETTARGAAFLDCPVAGSRPLAEAGEVIVLAGGAAEDVERWRPLLLTIGKAIVHAGPVGKGTALKLCMNLLVAQMTTGLAEAVAVARAQGLDAAKVFEVLRESPALGCGYFRAKEAPMLRGEFAAAFSLDNLHKDVRYVLDAGAANGLALPVTAAVEALLARASRAGHGADDVAGVVRSL